MCEIFNRQCNLCAYTRLALTTVYDNRVDIADLIADIDVPKSISESKRIHNVIDGINQEAEICASDHQMEKLGICFHDLKVRS